MAFSESLAQRIRAAIERQKGIVEKKMFGGIGFLYNGNLLGGVWKDSLIARLGPAEGDKALAEEHVKPFDITGKAMKGWVLVNSEGIESDEQLQGWVQRAMDFVEGLPRKTYSKISTPTPRVVVFRDRAITDKGVLAKLSRRTTGERQGGPPDSTPPDML